MTVSTTTDAPLDPKVDLPLLSFIDARPEPFGEALSGPFGATVKRAAQDFEADVRVLDPEHTVVLRHEAETGACRMPAEEAPGDARTAQELIEGVVLGPCRYCHDKTADGFEGPSAFLVQVGDDRDTDSMDEGIDRGRHFAAGAGTAPDPVFDPPTSSGAAWASATSSTRIQSSGRRLDRPGPPENGADLSARGRHGVWCSSPA